MTLSHGLCRPSEAGGKRPGISALSSPASKLLFSRVDASQAEGQRGVYLPAPNQLLGYNVPPHQGPPRDADQTLR